MIQEQKPVYEYPLLIKNLFDQPQNFYQEEKEIVYRDLWRYNYRKFAERVNRFSNGLKSLGVKKGSVVGILEWDTPRYLEAFFAIPMMGGVIHEINVRLAPQTLAYMINKVKDDILLVNEEFLPLIESIADRIKSVKKFILLTDSKKKPDTKLSIECEYEELLKSSSSTYDYPMDMDENTIASIFFTTGTTGLPKGVFFSHRQIVLHVFQVAIGLGAYESPARFRSNTVWMSLTPFYHVHAWCIPYLATMLGCKQVYPGRYDPEVILKLVREEGVTFTQCVPTLVQMVLNSPSAKETDMSNWVLDVGGSTLSRGLAQEMLNHGVKDLISTYGSSEDNAYSLAANLKEKMLDWDTGKKLDYLLKTGVPFPLVYAKVVDESGHEVPHDGKTPGELWLKSPQLTQGYFEEPERTKESFVNGWFHTADVATIDDEGYICIVDRTKDIIKTGGEWVSSIVLESMVSQHPAVAEAAAVEVPDKKWGGRPYIFAKLKPEYKGKVTEDELKNFLMEEFVNKGIIEKYAVPDRFEFTDEIAKTSVGKLDKKTLREAASHKVG